jgi:hypothetical protein
MAWTEIPPRLQEGQFIRITKSIRLSSFSEEVAVTSASFVAKYGTICNFNRTDVSINKDSVGMITTRQNSQDGSYWVKFGYELSDKDKGIKPNPYFNGRGVLVKLKHEGIRDSAVVWID